MDPAQRPDAAIAPVDNDGVVLVTAGTALWLVGLVVLSALHRTLSRDGHLWWIPTAAVGFALGLLGIGYCLRRRRRAAGRSPQ